MVGQNPWDTFQFSAARRKAKHSASYDCGEKNLQKLRTGNCDLPREFPGPHRRLHAHSTGWRKSTGK
jgi:hypothetical protein